MHSLGWIHPVMRFLQDPTSQYVSVVVQYGQVIPSHSVVAFPIPQGIPGLSSKPGLGLVLPTSTRLVTYASVALSLFPSGSQIVATVQTPATTSTSSRDTKR